MLKLKVSASDDVRKAFAQNKGFSDWNQEALKLHVEHSTRDLTEGNKTQRILKTPKEQEAVSSSMINVSGFF